MVGLVLCFVAWYEPPYLLVDANVDLVRYSLFQIVTHGLSMVLNHHLYRALGARYKPPTTVYYIWGYCYLAASGSNAEFISFIKANSFCTNCLTGSTKSKRCNTARTAATIMIK